MIDLIALMAAVSFCCFLKQEKIKRTAGTGTTKVRKPFAPDTES